jgi:putative inorganic carbon (hco3(-)) transporter
MPVRGALLLAYILLSVPVCFLRPFYGIALWTIIAFLDPQSFTWSAAAAFPWALAVGGATLCGFPFFAARGTSFRSGKFALLAILWIWFTVTSALSSNTPLFVHHAADTWSKWQFVSKILLMTVVTAAIVDRFSRLRTLVLVIAGCFGFFVIKSLPFILASQGAARIYGPDRSMISDNNDFGLALNMTLPLFFFLAQTETKPWVRRLFGFLFVLTIPTIFFTYSRGAMLGLVVLLSLMLLRMKRFALIVPVILIAVIAAMFLAPESWKQRMDPNNAIDSSARERFNAWTFSWNLAKEYPLAGGGFSTFTPELFSRYAPVAADIRGPHSIYFGVLAEHGFIGLALYLTLIASCFWTNRKLVKRARDLGDSVAANYATMFQFSLIGFLTSGAFLGRAYFDYFFTLVACIISLEHIALKEWATPEAASVAEDEHSADLTPLLVEAPL